MRCPVCLARRLNETSKKSGLPIEPHEPATLTRDSAKEQAIIRELNTELESITTKVTDPKEGSYRTRYGDGLVTLRYQPWSG